MGKSGTAASGFLQADLLPGTLYLMILRTLRGGPLHGYAIARRIKDASRDLVDVDDGSLYPALNRMLVKGWLKADWGVSENNRKARFYRLTPEGRKQLDSEAKNFDQIVRAVQLVMRTA
jgi:transcriptional regulator